MPVSFPVFDVPVLCHPSRRRRHRTLVLRRADEPRSPIRPARRTMQPMRIAVISDLHIGAEDFSADGFGEFLDHLEGEHDEIILLGDVFECYFPVLPWKALAEYERFDGQYNEITRRFRSAKYTLLSGN